MIDYRVPDFFKTADPILYGLLKEFAKENRNHQTDAEMALWSGLKGAELGVRFRRQYVIAEFIADFVCLEKALIIGVDGCYHYTMEQMTHDIYRTEELEKYGYRVIRFTNDEVIGNLDGVINRIRKEIYEGIDRTE